MNSTTLIKSFVLVGLITTVNTLVQAHNPLLAQASTQSLQDTSAESHMVNSTTGGGYNGNWMCLNNPQPQCSG